MNRALGMFAWIACASSSLPACGGDPAAAPGVMETPAPTAACAALGRELAAALDTAVEAQGVPGAAAAVDRGDCHFRGASGVADDVRGTPMKPGDLFRVGSITKSFVATLVLMLSAEGEVSLDSPVSAYVKDVPGGDGMTVRQLLNHTSGLPDYSEREDFWKTIEADPARVWKPRDLIAVAARSEPYFAPGQGWHYSNTDYIVAGLLVEAVGRRPLAEQLRARILDPQGLAHTYFDGEEPAAPGLIHGYELEGERPTDATWAADPSWAWAAGALVSNTDDLTRFYGRLLGGEVLAPTELQEMTTWARTTWPTVPGYGLGLSRRPLAGGVGEGHEGGIMGYVTAAFAIPDLGAEVTVLTNLGSGDAARIVDALSKVLKAR